MHSVPVVTEVAPAKVNLALEVLGRRDDGYHEVASIIQTIDLKDTLALEPAADITLVCDRPELVTPDNLVLKAAHLLKERTGYSQGAFITLEKRIPVSAGLGGGSSDAAAALRGLNRLWVLGLSLEDLTPLAARLGSDVPFFLRGGTAIVQGRGEKVRPLRPANLKWLVLLCPSISVPNKTASLYARLSPTHFTCGDMTHRLEARISAGGNVYPELLFNAFDAVAMYSFPGLVSYRDTFRSLGVGDVHVAGSGPSLFALVSHEKEGKAVELTLRHQYGCEAYLVSTWQTLEGKDT